MAVFPSRPLNTSPVHRTLRKHPSLFGVPFIALMVGASFALQQFTQTRYDLQDQKVSQMSKEEALGLKKNRKKFDIREEYYKLSQEVDDNWDMKRIQRPKGVPEWGVPPEEPAR
ncbi:hypothetical protein GLOTRDRAFT_71677 [Gloeophyllum trabeum ATCC 11539]|uniref:Cytochrome c oxidase assembly protein COX16, mitochondrial n=1 Tax=Gloeophyllum trabeum (strain ATCC 11539 / FP-39264 / Madison 617) TaxID=670483 RepID=S7RWR2_GLOTA|nr:uncharacterized protein GLOTRDRAFT_71677 [Gloeophyllum trabeum ATCC 11539]EPQ57794.1 hypothetical protein GLOTRDRAFT_71677 [Gloeophyllum trabeum ATCC 11539]